MSQKPSISELFERTIYYPDFEYKDRLERLVGLDEQKKKLAKLIGLLINSKGLDNWIEKYHPNAREIVHKYISRPPLVVLSGDVGSGKTELAETIGDAIARQENIDITLFPLSLSSRGQGRVGEMTQLLTAAFDFTVSEATKFKRDGRSNGAVILLVDEADAIAQSREANQMHHEDRAGVNAFIRGIDRIANNSLPAAVIMCTNRLNALDPAVKRRAADILIFSRPSQEQRYSVLAPLKQLGVSEETIQSVVKATGPKADRDYGCTFSDLVQRLIPNIILDSYPSQAITNDRIVQIAASFIPTPPFRDSFT